ncbi:branched-chain alpha-keto acid dehydrogenase E1-alpha subunit [Pyrrhoderma noxium]|uniref:2-oxoisovalerate dehydrogenase subunit alpha n=1 Tax=Pyrrhoderma noxium TaxID=2282107 RepID=A0A286UBG5_9AGAM|nr:branched-chain alpha-keto acid dehydrogenase E1-alpha subunit [Pyrrhoderma noxium]
MLALSRRIAPLDTFRRMSRCLATATPEKPDRKHGNLPGSSQSAITSHPHFFNSIMGDDNLIPTYRVIDTDGKPIDGAQLPDFDEGFCRKLYETMSTLPLMDNVLYNVQRQGKISFYMTSHGEEASIVGSAAALAPDDEVLGQYREVGVLLWRGLNPEEFMNQCFGNENDIASKGRQMPVHIGSPKYHFHTISSPLATQIPQAAGVGYALKRNSERKGKNCAVVYFGEGAASEGDFHAGMLLASTIPSPTLFFARNNGFAISTPASEQFHGDGVAARGPGYGVDTIRVDGNDVLAVLNATREARRRCIEEGRAVLIEAMTYRVGHHSTSDDSFAYRPRAEVEGWVRADNPLSRFRLFLQDRGWWSSEEEEQFKTKVKAELIASFRRAESKKRPALEELFTDIYAGSEPWNIKEQRDELAALVRKYGGVWDPWKKELTKFKGSGGSFTRSDRND